MDNNHSKQLSTLADLARQSEQRQFSFLQHLLLVISSTLGILASLHKSTFQSQYIRWVFALAVVVLCTSLLSCIFALIVQTQLPRRGQRLTAQEFANANREERKPDPVMIPKSSLQTICEVIIYISLPLSYILLGAYAIMSAFA